MSKTTKDIALSASKVKATTLDDERMLRVIATTPSLDRDLESLDSMSIQVPVKPRGLKYLSDMTSDDEVDLPFLIDHDWRLEKQAGSVKSFYINEAGETEALVKLSTVDNGERVYTLAKEGHLGNSFSIGYTLQNASLEDGQVKNLELLELSAVFKGSNRDARLLEVKSIKEETPMAEAKEEPKVEESPEEEVVETPEAETTETPAEAIAETVEEQKKEEVEIEKPAPEVAEPESKSIKKETTQMADHKEDAVKSIVDAPAPVQESTKALKIDKNAVRKNFVMQVASIFNKDDASLKAFRKEAAELSGTKVIDGTTGAPLYQSQIVSADIQRAYTNLGAVGALVQRIDIEGAETYKMLVEAAGTGFQPVALGGVKSQDQPVWTPITFTPHEWALIVPWLDGVAKRTPIAVYNQIVTYIAQEYRRLEDKVVLTYAGATVGGETFPATGLVPLLTTAGRVTTAATYGAADIQRAIGQSFGNILTDGQITIVANRATWGRLAVTVNTLGNSVFNTVGEQISAGALGTFNVVLSEQMPANTLVVGNLNDYLLVTRGELSTLFSQEATVGSLNLFTQDASALRADANITGGPTRINSFQLVTFTSAS